MKIVSMGTQLSKKSLSIEKNMEKDSPKNAMNSA